MWTTYSGLRHYPRENSNTLARQLLSMILKYINWNPDPEIINIVGISIRYYGLLFVSGLILCISLLGWIYKKESIPAENLEELSIYCMIGIMVGARLGHWIFYEPSYYLSHPLEMILPITFPPEGGIKFTGYQGLASHGGVLGLLIAIYIYSEKTKHSMIDTIDLIAVVAGLSFGFIRLGNFMNSEIIGMPASKPWGVIFERVDNIPRHLAQLYEAISYFIIFAFMMILYKKMRDRFRNGILFGLATVLFFTARFVIEFVKENQVAFEDKMTLNMGQLLSLPYIAAGIGFIIYGFMKTRKSIKANIQ